VLRRLLEDKQIVNPMNPEEVFTCKDLVDGNYLRLSTDLDYKVCRKERRL
jgi:hypothetical protein